MRWVAVASLGAAMATMVPAALWSRVMDGDPFRALPLPLVVAWMLGAQVVAHAALSATVGDPHAGVTGSVALHVLLAALSAVLVRRFEVCLSRAQAAGREPLHEPAPAPPRPSLHSPPRSLRLPGHALGRAPPRPA